MNKTPGPKPRTGDNAPVRMGVTLNITVGTRRWIEAEADAQGISVASLVLDLISARYGEHKTPSVNVAALHRRIAALSATMAELQTNVDDIRQMAGFPRPTQEEG